MMKVKTKRIVTNSVKYLIIAFLCVVLLFPILIMFIKAFTATDFSAAPLIIPPEWSLEGFKIAFNSEIVGWAGNTFLIAVINIIGITVSSSLCAYGFAKLKFHGREIVFSVVLATLMLPSVCMSLQLYSMYHSWNWIGTWYPLVIPGFFGGGAINIFLMRQYMRGIPDTICEAAKIDGASKFTIYTRLMVPMCIPIVCYVMVTTFMGVWNDLMGPLMYLQKSGSEPLYTLNLGLYLKTLSELDFQYANTQMAAGVGMLLPCLALFLVFQKSLIEGVTMGGVKG